MYDQRQASKEMPAVFLFVNLFEGEVSRCARPHELPGLVFEQFQKVIQSLVWGIKARLNEGLVSWQGTSAIAPPQAGTLWFPLVENVAWFVEWMRSSIERSPRPRDVLCTVHASGAELALDDCSTHMGSTFSASFISIFNVDDRYRPTYSTRALVVPIEGRPP